MPYVGCSACGLLCFSSARWMNVDSRGACGAELAYRRIDRRAAQPRVLIAPWADAATPRPRHRPAEQTQQS